MIIQRARKFLHPNTLNTCVPSCSISVYNKIFNKIQPYRLSIHDAFKVLKGRTPCIYAATILDFIMRRRTTKDTNVQLSGLVGTKRRQSSVLSFVALWRVRSCPQRQPSFAQSARLSGRKLGGIGKCTYVWLKLETKLFGTVVWNETKVVFNVIASVWASNYVETIRDTDTSRADVSSSR